MPSSPTAVPQVAWVGGHALRVRPAAPSEDGRGEQVHALCAALAEARIGGVLDLVPAWESLLVVLDEHAAGLEQVEAEVVRVLAGAGLASGKPAATRTHVLPVCTCAACAPDRDEVARSAGLDAHEVGARLLAPTYVVQMLGFTPGFPYLRGLDDVLRVPRLPSPRREVPAGSVAVAGAQAGIYPAATPGGWRLLGRTPHRLFDASQSPCAALAAGDRVRLQQVTHEQAWPATAPGPAGRR